MNLLTDKQTTYDDAPVKPLDKSNLCAEYTTWFNTKFPTDTKKPPTCQSPDWDSPGDKIEKIDDFLKDGTKWALACCWNSRNLTPNMQLGLCTKTDFNHDGKFIPSTTCDDYMTEYCTNNPQESICGCFRTDIANNKLDEVLFRKLKERDPELQPKCVMNRCYNPVAYRTRNMQKADCPYVCSSISSDPKYQEYVDVKCGTNDIIVNKIPDIIKQSPSSSLSSSYAQNNTTGNEKTYYKTAIFYVMGVTIIILLFLLTLKIWKISKK